MEKISKLILRGLVGYSTFELFDELLENDHRSVLLHTNPYISVLSKLVLGGAMVGNNMPFIIYFPTMYPATLFLRKYYIPMITDMKSNQTKNEGELR